MATKKARQQRRQPRPPVPAAAVAAQPPKLEPAPTATRDTPASQALEIQEPVICRALTHPKGFPSFLQFCCGKDRREELEVSLTIHNLWAGTTQVQQIPVLLEKDAPIIPHTQERPLVGVCTIAEAQVDVEGTGLAPQEHGALIGVIGTDLTYRKHKLNDGKTRPGVALVTGALKLIEQMFGGTMPFVRTNVLPTNNGSRPLFDEHYFENLGRPMQINERGEKRRADNLALFRPPGIAPAQKRQRTWSK